MSFSISEILVVLVIAVLVIKPEQMPDVAFSLGRFVSTIRRMFDKVKEDMTGIMDSVEKPTTTHAEATNATSEATSTVKAEEKR